MFSSQQHSECSSLRENIIEHIFIGSILMHLWKDGVTDVEILRSEFDGYGYDLVLSRGNLVRHIQLKSGIRKPVRVNVGLLLENKPGACVIFIQVDDALNQGPYFWFGSEAGEKIPSLEDLEVSTRPTHNSLGERPKRSAHRQLRSKHFERVEALESVIQKLLGENDDH